jgi:hypothetical protein
MAHNRKIGNKHKESEPRDKTRHKVSISGNDILALGAICAFTLGTPFATHAQTQSRPAEQQTIRDEPNPLAQQPDRSLIVRENSVALPPVAPAMKARYAASKAVLQPSANAWVAQQAKIEAAKPEPDVAALEATVRARFAASTHAAPDSSANSNNMAVQNMGVLPPGGDISEMCFVVLMEATADQDKDLELIMAETKAQTNAKQALRDIISKVGRDISANSGSQKPNAPCTTPGCRSLGQDLNQLSSLTAQINHPVRRSVPPQPTYAQLQTLEAQLKGDLDSLNEMSETESMRLQMAMDRRSKFVEALSNIMKKTSATDSAIIKNMK